MHAELMEFNQHLQKRLQDLESISPIEILDYPESNVKAYIPSAFLVGKKTHSYHVYQVNFCIIELVRFLQMFKMILSKNIL